MVVGLLFFAVGIVLLLVYCNRSTGPKPPDPYEPIEEFKGSWDSLQSKINRSKIKKKNNDSYDLENTIRVINSLEIALSQEENYEEYLAFMAGMDCSGVPPEVLESKAQLVPILQQLYLLQKEHDDLNLWTGVVQKLGGELFNQVDAGDVALLTMNEGIGVLQIMKKYADVAFEEYQKEQDLKKELRKQIDEIRLEYLNYLESFVPIYNKYMTEWNKLCLLRDKVYIDLYNNHPDLVLQDSKKVLAQYPDDRETLLLKAVALIQLSRRDGNDSPNIIIPGNDSISMSQSDALLAEAQKVIDHYYERYRENYSAPALLLEGLIQEYKGDYENASTFYGQSSAMYPEQAKYLTEFYDCYRIRAYLNKSLEGKYLLDLYRSTMTGSGFFSPNLMNARCLYKDNKKEACAQAIYSHFYRRSNQPTFDGFVLDMRYCEDHLTESFNQLLPERDYIKVSFKRHSRRKNKRQYLDVTVDNQADSPMTNLRIFLCINFTDMSKDDYYVIKLPTINRIDVRSQYKMDGVDEGIKLDYLDKGFNDITRVRAIAMTDTQICWVDNVYNATDKVDYNESHNVNYLKLSRELDSIALRSRDEYLASTLKSNEMMLRDDIMQYTKVTPEKKAWLWGWITIQNYINIELPRELILLNPTFTWNQSLMPVENYPQDKFIHLSFKADADRENVLYMTSKYLNYAINIQFVGDELKVTSVENLSDKP